MPLIEGIGNEVTHFFILLLVAILVYIGWISTSTSDRQIRSVLLLDRTWSPNRRVLRVLIPRLHGLGLGLHTEAVMESEGIGTPSTAASSTTVITERSEDSNLLNDTADNTDGNSSTVTENQSQVENAEKEESSIIEAMDADVNDQSELRQRRIPRFESPESATAEPNSETTSDDAESITIKLKYSNDDIRIVDGKLEETLGHFRRRHFTHEFTANKEVKLIFNGHILKQNLHSLRRHGIFNNCVVHCLVYPKRTPSSNDRALEIVESSSNYLPNVDFPHINVNNNNQAIDWDLTNFLYTAASVLLLAAWYFRYVYSNLYTIPATVGLTVLTALFSLIILGTFLPNDDFLATETTGNTRIRVSRADNATTTEPHQSPIINNS